MSQAVSGNCLATDSEIQLLVCACDCSLQTLRSCILAFLAGSAPLLISWAPGGSAAQTSSLTGCHFCLPVCTRASCWFIPQVSLEVALSHSGGSSPRCRCLSEAVSDVSRFWCFWQPTCVYLTCAQPHWSLSPLRSSVCVRREDN